MTENTYCDNCGVVLTTGNTVVYASLPYDVESAWAGESGQLCVGCDADLSSNGEECNTCGGTKRWDSTLEDNPTQLVDLGPCPDCSAPERRCDLCDDVIEDGTGFYIEPDESDEFAHLIVCKECFNHEVENEGCGKWGCKECYPGEEEGV